MPLEIVVTNAGRAALVNAANTGTLPVTIAQIGLSESVVAPAAGLTELAGEFARVDTIAGEVVADDTIHVSLRDDSASAYTLHSFALYLGDGTLFAIYGQADPILAKTAASVALLAMDVVFADVAAPELVFGDTDFALPSASTTRQGIVELATVAEAKAAADALRALTPSTAKAALLTWLLSLDGAGSGVDADLLDGQQGSYYANVIARLGYTPLNQVQFNAENVLTMLKLVDGAGSGLDADTVRGTVPLTIAASQLAPNGFIKFGNGFHIIWGSFALGSDSHNTTFNYSTISAAIALTSFSVPIVTGGPAATYQDNTTEVTGASKTGFSVYNGANAHTVRFIAVGF